MPAYNEMPRSESQPSFNDYPFPTWSRQQPQGVQQQVGIEQYLKVEEVVISGVSGKFSEYENIEEWSRDLYQTELQQQEKPLEKKFGYKQNECRFDLTVFGFQQGEKVEPELESLLKVTWQAILDAGLNPVELKGSRTGVFVGVSSELSMVFYNGLKNANLVRTNKNGQSTYASKLAHFFDFKGPHQSYEVTKPQSLIALDSAVNAIRTGLCDFAIVAGLISTQVEQQETTPYVVVPTPLEAEQQQQQQQIGVVFLQRKTEAKRYYAKVLHSKVQMDLAQPQQTIEDLTRFIRDVYTESKIDPNQVNYVELHSFGNDSIEINLIRDAFARMRIGQQQPLFIGSTKWNVGRLQSPTGIFNLIKVLLSIQNGTLPANIYHREQPERRDVMGGTWIKIADVNTRLTDGLIAISSMNRGEAYSHTILEPCREWLDRNVQTQKWLEQQQEEEFKRRFTEFTEKFNPSTLTQTTTSLPRREVAYEKEMPVHEKLARLVAELCAQGEQHQPKNGGKYERFNEMSLPEQQTIYKNGGKFEKFDRQYESIPSFVEQIYKNGGKFEKLAGDIVEQGIYKNGGKCEKIERQYESIPSAVEQVIYKNGGKCESRQQYESVFPALEQQWRQYVKLAQEQPRGEFVRQPTQVNNKWSTVKPTVKDLNQYLNHMSLYETEPVEETTTEHQPWGQAKFRPAVELSKERIEMLSQAKRIASLNDLENWRQMWEVASTTTPTQTRRDSLTREQQQPKSQYEMSYAMAYYALIVRANIRRGESVLIHDAVTPVSQAAIAIALHHGCKVYVTVRTCEEMEYIHLQHPSSKYNKDLIVMYFDDFERQLMQMTQEKGVSIVLNTVDEKLQSSFNVLAKHGRFLDIERQTGDKRKSWELPLINRAISYFHIVQDALLEPENQSLWQQIHKLIKDVKLIRQTALETIQLVEQTRSSMTHQQQQQPQFYQQPKFNCLMPKRVVEKLNHVEFTKSTQTPVIIVHPIEGHVNMLKGFAKHIKYPVYGLQYTAEALKYETVEQVAEFYLQQIEKEFNTLAMPMPTQFHLCGYGFGSNVAVEMALKKSCRFVSLTFLDGIQQQQPQQVKLGQSFYSLKNQVECEAEWLWGFVNQYTQINGINRRQFILDLCRLETLEQRIKYAVRELLATTRFSFDQIDAELAAKAYVTKFYMLQKYQPNAKLNMKQLLVVYPAQRNEQFSELDISTLFNGLLQVQIVDGDQRTFLESTSGVHVARILNEYLMSF